MQITMRGAFSVPVGETWIKCDVEISLNEKEINNPVLYKVSSTLEKGIKLINGELEKHLDKQISAIKKMAEDIQ